VNRNDTLNVITWGFDKNNAGITNTDAAAEEIPDILQSLKSNISVNNLIQLPREQPAIIQGNMRRSELSMLKLIPYGVMEDHQSMVLKVCSHPVFIEQSPESYYDRYDNYDLAIWCMREIFPGKYTMYNKLSGNKSTLRQLFPSQTFINGWSLYSADMLLSAGYGQADYKYELSYLRQVLNIAAGTIAELQTFLSPDSIRSDLESFLSRQGFLNAFEIQLILEASRLKPCNLPSQLYGLNRLLDYRGLYEQEKGKKYSINEFHKNILATGPLSVDQIIQLFD